MGVVAQGFLVVFRTFGTGVDFFGDGRLGLVSGRFTTTHTAPPSFRASRISRGRCFASRSVRSSDPTTTIQASPSAAVGSRTGRLLDSMAKIPSPTRVDPGGSSGTRKFTPVSMACHFTPSSLERRCFRAPTGIARSCSQFEIACWPTSRRRERFPWVQPKCRRIARIRSPGVLGVGRFPLAP